MGYGRPTSPNVVLVVGGDCEVFDPEPYEVIVAANPFAAGYTICHRYPAAIIVSASLSPQDIAEIAEGCSTLNDYRPALIAALPPAISPPLLGGKGKVKNGIGGIDSLSSPAIPPIFVKMGFPHAVQAGAGLTGEAIGMLLRRTGGVSYA